MGGSINQTQQFQNVFQSQNQQIKDGSISITNGISGTINVSIGVDTEANYQSKAYIQIYSGKSNTFPRICRNGYQIFITDPDKFTYGFIILGGGLYTYKGQGKLWDNERGIYNEEDDENLSTPGNIVVKAFRSNVNVSLSGGANNTYNINENQFVRFSRQQGSHVIRFADSFGVEKVYLLTSGRSYYIYNSGSCIDKDSNVVLPLYKEDDNAMATYDDDSLNSLLVSSGNMHSMSQFSSQSSVQKSFGYSNSSSSSSFGYANSASSSSYQSSSQYSQSSSSFSSSRMSGTTYEGFGVSNVIIY